MPHSSLMTSLQRIGFTVVLQVTETVWGPENHTFLAQLCYIIGRDRKSIKTSNNWMIYTDPAVQEIEDLKATEPAAWFKSRMTSHNLLVAVLTASCVALSTADNTITLTYPAKVVNTAQGECPSDTQREMVIAEVKEDIRNLLPVLRKSPSIMLNQKHFTCPGRYVLHIVR